MEDQVIEYEFKSTDEAEVFCDMIQEIRNVTFKRIDNAVEVTIDLRGASYLLDTLEVLENKFKEVEYD